MNQFESWRREVNIILNDTVGFSLRDMADNISDKAKELYEFGEDPLSAAQEIAQELDPAFDLEQILKERVTLKMKPPSKKAKKFKVVE